MSSIIRTCAAPRIAELIAMAGTRAVEAARNESVRDAAQNKMRAYLDALIAALENASGAPDMVFAASQALKSAHGLEGQILADTQANLFQIWEYPESFSIKNAQGYFK